MMVRPFLVVTLPDGAGDRPAPVRTQLRAALALAGVSPWRTLLMAVLDLATVLSGCVSLILIPLVGGFVLAIQARLLGEAQARLDLSTRRRRLQIGEGFRCRPTRSQTARSCDQGSQLR
jgi:hypothetical protein